MTQHLAQKHGRLIGTALAAALAIAALGNTAAPALAKSAAVSNPQGSLSVAVGRGRLVTLPSPISDIFIADNKVADVQVRSTKQIYIFGKKGGQTSFYATNAAGAVVYSAEVVVGADISSIDQMLSMAMPDANIAVSTSNNFVLLTGTVGSPDDVSEVEGLVQAYVGEDVKVVSRLKTATPMQVNLQVRIAEVSRSLAKEINGNLVTRDTSGGFLFGLNRGRGIGSISNFNTSGLPNLDASNLFGLPAGSISLPFDPATGNFITGGTSFNYTDVAGLNTVKAAGKLFGMDIMTAFDVAERSGLISTLATPNLTTISGETATFLAGGQFPVPVAQGLGDISVQYRDYGVSLSYTPTVLANGRISIRVAPEVSEISSQGAVRLNGFEIPAITIRKAETTVELGSGESFMIAGLLQNNYSSSIDKTPGLGDVPVLGNLFKSDGFRRNETELMIVVTPYLVKPVSDNEIVLPTDGFRNANDAERLLLNKRTSGETGGDRPKPMVAPPAGTGPAISSVEPQEKGKQAKSDGSDKKARKTASAAPGFSF
jgi:pilus assembly protein CpaC